MKMENRVVWCDIPVQDLDRAMRFYSSVFEVELKPMKAGADPSCPPLNVAFFPFAPGVASAALVEGGKPSVDGPLVYLSGGEDLAVPLARVEAAGGKVLMPKTGMGHGFLAHFQDSEGNRIALHSAK